MHWRKCSPAPKPPPLDLRPFLSFIVGFIVIVLTNSQDQPLFYITPPYALTLFTSNTPKTCFGLDRLIFCRLRHPFLASSSEIEFVVTDILARFEGSLFDRFLEGHSGNRAKHDYKFVPKVVATALEKHKKKLEEEV
ncbi:hypothetical protein IEQ34_013666 [Dendrobium chrysotoxum]|uniref:Uncharacterized protein n=1 Tax=Dendrobium chrysotoxum TaxID=161865 RepID=A0AAV7GP40_DENCH|nr:hypothetical protein IEQ34_013666 [Dendrobium chrysotoxum]